MNDGSIKPADDLVLFIDVDNTLIDNDRVIAEFNAHIETSLGTEQAKRYWACFEAVRDEVGFADYLGGLQRFRGEQPARDMSDPRLLQMARFMIEYPFAERLYPGALQAVAHLRSIGTTVILSDGDVVLQPRKVQRSGLWDAVDGAVLIYIHKEKMLDTIEQLYPARHYVMVDDKLRILAAMKAAMGDKLTTVFPRQGHYALDPAEFTRYPAADITLESIAALTGLSAADFNGTGNAA